MDTPPVSVKKNLSYSLTKNSLTPCRRVGLGRPSSGNFIKLVQVRTVSTPPSDSAYVTNEKSVPEIADRVLQVAPGCGLPSRASTKQNYDIKRVRRCLTQSPKSYVDLNAKQPIDNKKTKILFSVNKVMEHDSVVGDSSHAGSSQFKKFKSAKSSPLIIKTIVEGSKNKYALLSDTKSRESSTNYQMFEKNETVPEEIVVQLMLSLLEKKKKLDALQVQEGYLKKHNLEELQAQTAKWRAAGQEALRYCVKLASQIGYSVTIPQLMEQHGFPPNLMGYSSENEDFE